MTQMSAPGAEVFIVDDDPAIREVLALLFTRAGYRATCFADGAALLVSARATVPACIILDVNIPGRSGLDILKQLNAEEYPAPIFVISGEGDIPMAVDAIRNGALDFIEKPFRGPEVVERIKESIAAWAERQQDGASTPAAALAIAGREPFTRRERDVLNLILAGASSKEAGRQMGISPRTVEFHRARIMEKVDAKNTADLIRIIMSRHAPNGSRSHDVESSI
jgi:FixJ family two-component response regulator